MLKRIGEPIIAFLLIIVATVLIYRAFFAPKQQIIVKEREVIKVEGRIEYVDKEKTVVKPYALILDNIDGEWKLDKELSYLPSEMTVDTVSFKKKFDWKSPVRVGFSLDKRAILCYNVANINGVEFGPMIGYGVDGSGVDVGVDVGYKYRNITIFGGYFVFDRKATFGIAFKPF